MTGIPQSIINELESFHLPSIPKVLLGVLCLLEDDRVAMADVAELVRRDPGLTARILTVANSPALRQTSEIRNIEQCLIVIGINLLRTITASLAIQTVFASDSSQQRYDFKGFWKHSLLISEIARGLAIKVNHSDAEEAYLSALLHDVGQLLLLSGLGEKYSIILDKCRDEESLLRLEKPILGTNHAEVGAWLIDQWKFSSFMADAVMFHHYSPKELATANQLIQITWAAHILPTFYTPDQADSEDLVSIMAMFDIDSAAIATIFKQASERVAKIAVELGISGINTGTMPSLCTDIISSNITNPEQSLIQNKVRDMAIMQPLLLNLLQLCSEAEILISLQEASKILFELGSPSFFLINQDKTTLSGAEILGQPELLQLLEIKISPDNSLATSAITSNSIVSTYDLENSTSVSLVDIQLARILGKEGLLYVPICNNGQNIGLIIYGLTQRQYDKSINQLSWIESFARIAAISIDTCRNIQTRENNLQTDLRKQFDQHMRKVIHEAGNPLGIIKNYLTIVSSRLPDDNEVREELGIISEEIDRVSHIVRQLNNQTVLSKNIGTLDINKLIDGMLALYGESLFTSRGIFIKKNLDKTLSPINADRDLVKQILLNIWKNGSEAMQVGGCFVISTRDSVNLNGEYFTEIQMSDSGPGLPHDIVTNVFEQLEPDKKPGHYGIGLSIVESLVEQLNGFIFFHSHPGVGTSFSILLPVQSRGGL